jgi:eukaryotic-like serine/threonine-protein kinase
MATAPETETRPTKLSLDFLETIARSGVLAGSTLEEIRAKLRDGSYPAVAAPLARRLVKQGTLTEFQARLLLYGRHKGLVIGRYVVLDRLGGGSMGRVYLARHRLMGRTVALKLIATEYLSRPHAVPRFLREMRLVGRLDHPNIVRALDADVVAGSPYIVMEYVPGCDLGRLLEGGTPPSPREVARYAAEAAEGLAHAHQRGVLHRDVKPSNLLLGEDGRVRLLDLGVGALMDPGDDVDSFATAEGMVAGTDDYMSPEQAVGRGDVDGRADLYSLGCVMYHLLAGRVPFPGDSRVERLASRIKGRPVPLAELRPGLPPKLVGVVARLMANRPCDRYPTASEAAEALRDVAGGGGHAPAPPPPAPSSASSSGVFAPAPSTTQIPADPPSRWLRFLALLAERSPARVLLAASAVVTAAFAAGCALASALR